MVVFYILQSGDIPLSSKAKPFQVQMLCNSGVTLHCMSKYKTLMVFAVSVRILNFVVS